MINSAALPKVAFQQSADSVAQMFGEFLGCAAHRELATWVIETHRKDDKPSPNSHESGA
jgi:hypothetical protein